MKWGSIQLQYDVPKKTNGAVAVFNLLFSIYY